MEQKHNLERLSRLLGQWLLCAVVLAAALPAGAAATLHLGPRPTTYDTAGYLERLDDPRGTLDAAQADAAEGWAPLPGSLNAGFTRSAIWLRLTVDVDEAEPDGWMLRLGNALLDDVQVYVQERGAWVLLGHGGEDVPRRDWPVDYRSPAFRFAPATAGRHVLLLRLQGKNAIVTRLEIMPRLAFENQSRREGLLFGAYAGFYLLLIGLHAVFWRMTRAPMSGLFFAYIGFCVFNEVLSLGPIQQLTGLPVEISDPLVGLGIACALPIAVAMALRQMDVGRLYPRAVRWTLRLLSAVVLVCSLLILSGRFAAGMQPIQLLAIVMIPVLVTLAGCLMWRGWRPARYFVPIFGVFYAGVAIGFLRNLGVVPVNAFTEYSSMLGTMVHMLLLSLFIIGRHERQRRARELRQANLAAELAREHNQRLERQVAQRTADLSEEIRRREQVEEELRQALESERQVLAEQRDFVAMVSHEFRTPLAIIGTSAQQLSRNLDAPLDKSQARCRNIWEASLRLLSLVDQYLTDDRIREPRAELQEDLCDLRGMLAELESAFPQGRIRCRFDLQDVSLRSDAGLLHIALRNLLANADRHAPAGSVVDVSVRDGGRVLDIEVSNRGPRIPEPERGRLFQKYYRGQSARLKPGAGLGLYLVRSIAARLGGSVILAQAGGEEPVTFRLSLPRRTAA